MRNTQIGSYSNEKTQNQKREITKLKVGNEKVEIGNGK